MYCAINAEEPFVLPNIVGFEKAAGYVHFDLIQLLALLLPRSILKVDFHTYREDFFPNSDVHLQLI